MEKLEAIGDRPVRGLLGGALIDEQERRNRRVVDHEESKSWGMGPVVRGAHKSPGSWAMTIIFPCLQQGHWNQSTPVRSSNC